MNGKLYAWGFVLVLMASLASGCGRATPEPTMVLPGPTSTFLAVEETPVATFTLEPPVRETPEATSTLKAPGTETPGVSPTSQVPFEETPETAPATVAPPVGTPAPTPASDAVSGRVCPQLAPVDREGQ